MGRERERFEAGRSSLPSGPRQSDAGDTALPLGSPGSDGRSIPSPSQCFIWSHTQACADEFHVDETMATGSHGTDDEPGRTGGASGAYL